jgi:hypothetical protein
MDSRNALISSHCARLTLGVRMFAWPAALEFFMMSFFLLPIESSSTGRVCAGEASHAA